MKYLRLPTKLQDLLRVTADDTLPEMPDDEIVVYGDLPKVEEQATAAIAFRVAMYCFLDELVILKNKADAPRPQVGCREQLVQAAERLRKRFGPGEVNLMLVIGHMFDRPGEPANLLEIVPELKIFNSGSHKLHYDSYLIAWTADTKPELRFYCPEPEQSKGTKDRWVFKPRYDIALLPGTVEIITQP